MEPDPDTDPTVAAYAAGERRARAYLLGGWFGGMAVGWLFGLPLAGLGIAVLVPVYGLVAHLRCPACNAMNRAFWRSSVADCGRCGVRLRP